MIFVAYICLLKNMPYGWEGEKKGEGRAGECGGVPPSGVRGRGRSGDWRMENGKKGGVVVGG